MFIGKDGLIHFSRFHSWSFAQMYKPSSPSSSVHMKLEQMLMVREDGDMVPKKFNFKLEDCPSVLIGKMFFENVALEMCLFFVEEHCLNRKKVLLLFIYFIPLF